MAVALVFNDEVYPLIENRDRYKVPLVNIKHTLSLRGVHTLSLRGVH